MERKTQNHLEKIPEKIINQIDKTLLKAKHIIHQKRGDPDYLYSWHRPEVECIGKAKAKTPYEFGCNLHSRGLITREEGERPDGYISLSAL